ncbi:MAG TPA: hypothetical protein VGZ73_29620 [Bryobacteraceae bacterium]|jgi:hypothetical protein|nr:hypothetical protein [Bryobacteraceae bacterium]
MRCYTIDGENKITVHASRKDARHTGNGVFSTEEQFADLIGPDTQRLVEIWNGLPGVRPVTRFGNLKVAAEYVWKAIQALSGPPVPKGVIEVILDGYGGRDYVN